MDPSDIDPSSHSHHPHSVVRFSSRLHRAYGRRLSVVHLLRQDTCVGLIAVGVLECLTHLIKTPFLRTYGFSEVFLLCGRLSGTFEQ